MQNGGQSWSWPEFALLLCQLARLVGGITLLRPEAVRQEVMAVIAAQKRKRVSITADPMVASSPTVWAVKADEKRVYDALFLQYTAGGTILTGNINCFHSYL